VLPQTGAVGEDDPLAIVLSNRSISLSVTSCCEGVGLGGGLAEAASVFHLRWRGRMDRQGRKAVRRGAVKDMTLRVGRNE
jgi:hypothetical protein